MNGTGALTRRDPGARRDAPEGRPARTSVWRLPPWTRAPWLGLLSPGAVVAVLVTTAILACAVASAPLFLSSARSGALQSELAPQCAEASWPTIGGLLPVTPGTTPDQAVRPADRYRDAWTAQGHSSSRVLQVMRSVGRSGNDQYGMPVDGVQHQELSQPATVFWRPGATGHVHAVSSSGGSGVWLPQSYAQAAGARVGDQITMAGAAVPVAGVYTDLFDTDYGPYWCDYKTLFLNLASANTPPPALVLAADQSTALRLAAAAHWYTVLQQVPVDSTTLSVSRADELLAEQERAQAAGPQLPAPQFAQFNTRLPEAVAQAERIESGLRGPVIPVAVAGGLLALVLVASAGSFWADRRAAEVRLLAARGVGPGALAGKAALEFALPALVGAALGWSASRLLVAGLGPANDLDPSATRTALAAGVAAFVVGLTCAAVVAGLRARGTAERPLGAPPRWPAKVPWELALVGGAVWCWALLADRSGIVLDHNVAQVDGLLVAFPLLGIAGMAVLLGRVLTTGLPALRRWAARRRPAVFLAVNRLAAARLTTGMLLVAVALPVAVLGYTATLTQSSQTTIDAKTGVEIGAAEAVTTTSFVTPGPRTDAVGTVVQRYGSASVSDGATGQQSDVQMLAVDPRTFAGTAYWQPSFAGESLDDLVGRLTGPRISGRLPVVAQGLPEGPADVGLGSVRVPVQVVATARVLPGRRAVAPMLLVSATRLPRAGDVHGADRTSEVWTNGPLRPALRALLAAGGQAPQTFTETSVFTAANFLGINWTFGYLSALAVFVGVIAVGGLLLYLEARSRTRVSGYVMARRLGLSRGAHLRSLVVELLGVGVAGLVVGAVLAAGAVAVVYRRLDVDLVRPPTPLLDVPWLAVLLTAVVTALVAVAAAAYAQRAADRADPATVLREDA